MKWKNGCVYVEHPREPWRNLGPDEILVHCRLDQLNGNSPEFGGQQAALQVTYEKAKFSFDTDAAFDIIDRCVDGEITGKLAKLVKECPVPPRLIYPHPAFDDDDGVGSQTPIGELPTNALPFAYAAYLESTLGCVIDEDVVQAERVGRTKLKRFLRFLCQPSFIGEIISGHPYIILDDVATTGGTFAALRSYVVRQGGTVVAATALAHTHGRSQKFPIAQSTADVLKSIYGTELEPYWREAMGHEILDLTEAEAQFLAQWGLDEQKRHGCAPGNETFQLLRNRINQAASKGG